MAVFLMIHKILRLNNLIIEFFIISDKKSGEIIAAARATPMMKYS
jgi:hypothetical protein